MSDDIAKLQRLLEQATAAGGESDDNLDAETLAMRETWLAFGQLLEASSSAGPLAGRGMVMLSPLPLGERPEARGAEGSINRPTLPLKHTNRWLLTAAGLLAASLLLAIVTGWITRNGWQQNLPPEPQQTVSTKQPKNTTAANVPQWDDSLDEQFAQVDQHLLDARSDQYADAGSLTSIQHQIETMRQDIQTDSL